MDQRPLTLALTVVGWSCVGGGLALAASLLWAAGIEGLLPALLALGGGLVAGLTLLGFAMNLRLIGAILHRLDGIEGCRDRREP